jgi:fatty-acyl-CoA synthase
MGLIGCVLGPLLAQRPIYYLDTLAFLKRPRLWFDLIHRHRANVTFAPQFALALAVRRTKAADLAQWDLSCLRVLGCGGEPIAAETLRSFSEHFSAAGLSLNALCPSYGLAEATLMVTHHPDGQRWVSEVVDADRLQEEGDAHPPRSGSRTLELVSCGAAIAGHELRVVDQAGQARRDRQVGEIEVRGPCVTAGYFRDPIETAQANDDGWLRTGDQGYLSNGHLFVAGRTRDLVIVRGRNYAPETIEWAVNGLASVRTGNVVAFSHLDSSGAERLVVVCETRTPDVAATQLEVAQSVHDALGLKVDEVLALPPGVLPKTSSGKAQRAKTRAMFVDGSLRHTAEARRRHGTRMDRAIRVRLGWRGLVGSIRYRARRTRRRLSSAGRASNGR